MLKANTIRNYRIASLYGRMSYGKIAKLIGCSQSCVAGVVRWHVLKVPRVREEDRESLPPSVAYVKGLESMRNTRYIMRSNGNG